MTNPQQKSTTSPIMEDTLSNLIMTDLPAAHSAVETGSFDLSGVVETILASPEFKNSTRFDDFLVSPSLSPCNDFNMSPIDDSPLTPNLDTPIMNDLVDDFGTYGSEYGGIPLFNDGTLSMYQLLESQYIAQEQVNVLPKSASIVLPLFDAVNPTSLVESAVTDPSSEPSAPSSKTKSGRGRKATATGTRKNITPESLVPVDAPIQARKYVSPSATSRKELPAAFLKSQKRKRSRTQAFGDEEAQCSPSSPPAEGDAAEEQPPLNATEKELIEWKRRQNTLAARKSRKRKLEHQQLLETRVKDLECENEMLKVRAETLEAALRAHDIFLPATEA